MRASGLSSSNLNDELRSRGIQDVAGLKKLWDVDPAVGGRHHPRQAVVLFLIPVVARQPVPRRHLLQPESARLHLQPDLARPAFVTVTDGDYNTRLTRAGDAAEQGCAVLRSAAARRAPPELRLADLARGDQLHALSAELFHAGGVEIAGDQPSDARGAASAARTSTTTRACRTGRKTDWSSFPARCRSPSSRPA